MKRHITFTLLLMASLLYANGQTQDNAQLQAMHDEDQRARQSQSINWIVLGKEDSVRRVRTLEMIKANQVVTAKDHYNAAMIFQHGGDTIASAIAIEQMRKAIELDATMNKWLLAAAIDRDLMRRDKPQIYGTQYIKMGDADKWHLYKIDTTQVTDAARREYHVETLAEQREKERAMNQKSINEFYARSKSASKTIAFIKEEYKNPQSDYNVSEDGINTFGYELMANNKTEDALAVFKLNTILYPEGYNTFDSYGECLLKLGKKEEALKAYRKSLELNPDNNNAKKILAENR